MATEERRATGIVWLVRHEWIQSPLGAYFPNRAYRRHKARRSHKHRLMRPIYEPFRWANHAQVLGGSVKL